MTAKTKLTAAIVGSGNIGTDLMYKLERSEFIEPKWMIGIDAESEGMKRAADHGLTCMSGGADELLDSIEAGGEKPDLLFEATSAYVHKAYAPRYEAAGIIAVDLTPAAVGPMVIPPANLHEHVEAPNHNMVTCGGQATIPMVHAVSSIVPVEYAEIVASVSSESAGPGTRANIDEFTETTKLAIEKVGGAKRGKAIIILNPAEPPMIMRDTIFCAIPEDADQDLITTAIRKREKEIQEYVPGYRLLQEPQFDPPTEITGGMARVAIFVEVEGAGDFLPPYAGNLDIMTAAATKVGEDIARTRLARTEPATTTPGV